MNNSAASHHVQLLEPRRLLASIELDLSFGNGTGLVAQVLGPGPANLHDIEVIVPVADGKFLAAGTTDGGGLRLARLNPDGWRDWTFGGGDGIAEGHGLHVVHDGLLQSDGKLVLVGISNLDYPRMAAFRFNADGTPDASFGDNGLAVLPGVGAADGSAAHAVARQLDGKLVLAGTVPGTGEPPLEDLVLCRLNNDGSLDTAFGDENGFEVVYGLGSTMIAVRDLVITSGGKLLFAGSFTFIDSDRPKVAYIARYNADGTPDTSQFSNTDYLGFHTNALVEEFASIESLALVPGSDGDFLVGGKTVESQFPEIATGAIARFNADGSPDTTFGDAGITRNLGVQEVRDLHVLGDGKIAAAGGSPQGIGLAFRLLPSGQPDATFNGSGVFDAGHVADVSAFAVADDGDVLLAGYGTIVRAGERPAQLLTFNGVLQVTGTDDADNITIVRNGDRIVLNRNGFISNFAAQRILQLDVHLEAGDDDLVVGHDVAARSSPIVTGTGGDRVTLADGHYGINAYGPLVLRAGDGEMFCQVLDGAADIEVGDGVHVLWTDSFNDTIVAGHGGNAILAGGGDDFVRTGDGNDKILAGDGADTVHGGGGDDRIWGDGGRDSLYGGAGRDVMLGGASGDYINGGGGNDRLAGDGGNDRIYAGNGNDALDAGAGLDRLFGHAGVDKLFGATASGANTLTGGAGADFLFPADGDDTDPDPLDVVTR